MSSQRDEIPIIRPLLIWFAGSRLSAIAVVSADGREIRRCVGTTATVHRLDNDQCENTVSLRTLEALLKRHLIIEDYRHHLAAGVHCYRLTEQGKRVAEECQ